MQAEKEDLHISESGLPLHLNVAELEGIAASSMADWVKQSESVSLYVQISAAFRGDTGRNRFGAKSWARTIDLAFNEMGRRVAVANCFWRWQSNGYSAWKSYAGLILMDRGTPSGT